MKKRWLITLGALIFLLAVLGHTLTHFHPVRDPRQPSLTQNLAESTAGEHAHPAIS